MNKIANSKIAAAIISIVLGVLLILFQGIAIDTAVKIIGIIFLVAAAATVVMFFVQKGSPMYFVLTAVMLVVGIILLARPRIFSDILPLFLGIFLIASGILNMSQLILFPEKNFKWVLSLILSILVVALGIIVLLNMSRALNTIAVWVGVAYLISGITDLIFFIFYRERD